MFRRLNGQGGYLIGSDPTSSLPIERDSFTCRHCNKVQLVKPYTDPRDYGGKCNRCQGIICRACVEKARAGARCLPFEDFLTKIERHDQFRRDAGLTEY